MDFIFSAFASCLFNIVIMFMKASVLYVRPNVEERRALNQGAAAMFPFLLKTTKTKHLDAPAFGPSQWG